MIVGNDKRDYEIGEQHSGSDLRIKPARCDTGVGRNYEIGNQHSRVLPDDSAESELNTLLRKEQLGAGIIAVRLSLRSSFH